MDTATTKFSRLHVKSISKRKLEKWRAGTKISALVEESKLREKMTEALQSDGRIYAYYEKKDMIACFLFTAAIEEITTPYIEGQELLKEDQKEKEGEKKPEKIYRLTDIFLLPEYEEHAARMKEYILADMKEWIALTDASAIYWEEEIIRKKKIKLGSLGYFTGITFGISMGILFGIAFDNIALGICLGICFAGSGLIWSVTPKKEQG